MTTGLAADYTIPELLACFLSHDLKDGEVLVVGAATPIARAAVLLAHLSHGPNMKLYLAYSRTNLLHVPVMASFHSEADFRQARWAEAYLRDEDLLMDMKRASQRRFFIGAVQVDKHGNSNLIGVGDDYQRLKFRGPGGVGTPTLTAYAKCYYILLNSHDRRIFVERCAYTTSVGWGEGGADGRRQLGLPGGGPKYILTPLCIMDFEEHSKRMRLKSVHPRVSVQQVMDNTGFPLILPPQVPTIPPPTRRELELLRSRVDVDGVLRQRP